MREAIDSALAQTYDNIEIILVNDGSTDNTEEIALSYGDKIRYLSKENGGTPTALNMGIENMRGEYFSWLSHDDLYKPHKIQREIEELSKLENKNTVILSNCEVINDKYIKIAEFCVEESITAHPAREFSKQFYVLYSKMHCCFCISKICFETIGKFNEDIRTAHDNEMVYRILDNFPFKFIPDVLYTARDSGGRQGRRARLRCNIEYSLVNINIIEKMTDDDILMICKTKEEFYLELRECYSTAYTIAAEYVDVLCQSMGIKSYRKISKNNIIKKLHQSIKRKGLKKTFQRIIEKIFKL